MKRILILFALAATCAQAQILVSDFSNFTAGYFSQSDENPWSEQTAQSGATAFTVADFGNGTPGGKIGNGFIQWNPVVADWSGYAYVSLSGLALSVNATPSLNFYVEDINGLVALTNFSLPGFSGSLKTVNVAFETAGIDLAQVAFWGFTVGEADSPVFGFTFDNVSLTNQSTVPVTPVPEPSTYGVVASIALAGFVAMRRFRRA